MAAMLITYQLTHAETDFTSFIASIQEYSHVRLTDASYLIETKLSSQDVYDELRAFVDSKDTLFVFELSEKWKGHGMIEVVDWVLKTL